VLIGAHVSAAGGLDKSLERMQAIGAEAAQIFVQSPRTWRPTNHKPDTIERFKAEKKRLGAPVFVHALYLVNLASENEELFRKSIDTMCITMDVASRIESEGVVFHIGSHGGSGFDQALDRVCKAMAKILEHTSDTTWLLMENSAGGGGTVGRSLEELGELYRRLGEHERLGVCLDSCHLFVSGRDITDRKKLDRLVEELDQEIGLERLRVLHINDAKAPLGSNRDRHANIGEGLMGEKLSIFLAHPAFGNLAAVLETPGPDGHGPDAAEVEKLRELCRHS
jgi:deoxyribonuclease-4